jgi:hypothetical protein
MWIPVELAKRKWGRRSVYLCDGRSFLSLCNAQSEPAAGGSLINNLTTMQTAQIEASVHTKLTLSIHSFRDRHGKRPGSYQEIVVTRGNPSPVCAHWSILGYACPLLVKAHCKRHRAVIKLVLASRTMGCLHDVPTLHTSRWQMMLLH